MGLEAINNLPVNPLGGPLCGRSTEDWLSACFIRQGTDRSNTMQER
jgi:hypothetical protein